MWCSIRNIRSNKLVSSSPPKIHFALRDNIFNLWKRNPGPDESTSPVLSYSRWITMFEYVVWTLVRTGFALFSVTLLKTAARNLITVSIALESFSSSILFTSIDLKNPFTCKDVFLKERSNWRSKTRKRCLYYSNKLLRPVRSWFLKYNSFFQVALFGSEYTAMSEIKYASVHSFSSWRYRDAEHVMVKREKFSFYHSAKFYYWHIC